MNLLLPIIVLFVLILLIAVSAKDKNGNKKQEYDERQKMILNEAWRRAGLTGIVLNLVFAMAFAWSSSLPFDASFAFTVVCYICCLVYALYSIFHGAYFGIHNRWKRSIPAISILAVFELIAGIIQIKRDYVQDDRLTLMNSSTLMIGITFTIIVICVLIEEVRERKENG